jgi:phytoene dehydrogenase-like protein
LTRWSRATIHPEQMGPTGYPGQPLGTDGLYFGSADCHGGPGITFTPGYSAAQAVPGN